MKQYELKVVVRHKIGEISLALIERGDQVELYRFIESVIEEVVRDKTNPLPEKIEVPAMTSYIGNEDALNNEFFLNWHGKVSVRWKNVTIPLVQIVGSNEIRAVISYKESIEDIKYGEPFNVKIERESCLNTHFPI